MQRPLLKSLLPALTKSLVEPRDFEAAGGVAEPLTRDGPQNVLMFTHVFAIAGMRSLGSDSHMQNAAPFFCNPGLAQPVYYTGIHGTADTTVAYGGDPDGSNVTDVPSGIYLSAQASAEAWGTANGCTGTFASYTTNTTFIQGGATTTTLFRYPTQAAGGDVEFASLAGVGHNPNTAEEFFRYVHGRFWNMPRP